MRYGWAENDNAGAYKIVKKRRKRIFLIKIIDVQKKKRRLSYNV